MATVDMSVVNKALKYLYIEPIRNDIKQKSDPFIDKVLQDTTKIVGNTKIVRDAQVGVSGGVGAGTETGALPSAAGLLYEYIESDVKNLYGAIEMSDKVMKAVTGPNAGSFINVLNREMTGMLKTARWNYARQAYGNGSGKLAVMKANVSTSTLIELATGESTRFLLPGLSVDLIKDADKTVYSGKNGMRITNVDHKAKKITLDTTTPITAADFLVIQGSYGLEMTGLGKLCEAETYNAETLYGKTRADYSWLQPYYDASFGALDETGMQDVMNLVEDHWNVNFDYMSVGNSAYNYFYQLLADRRALNDVQVLEGGFKSLKYNGMLLVRNPNLVADEIMILDTSIFTVDQISDWDWLAGNEGVLNLKPGYPIYTGAVTKYCDLMCQLPAGIIRLGGVQAPAA